MSFPRYEAYKDSGVEWLGEVPEHWTVYRSKVIFAERNIKATESDEQLTASQKYGVIPQKLFSELEGQKVMQVILGRDILKKAEINDFVISMRSFQGGLEFCAYSGAVSSAYVPLFATKNLDNSFFRYLFKAKPFIAALQQTTNLVRDGQALRYRNFTQLSLPFPKLDAQKIIGSFLDHETASIDTLIAEQQRLIELLKEKRQAVISHAVTKGLDPTVPMKDSGVEWLGQVPEHWTVAKVKYVVQSFEQGWSPQCDNVPVENDKEWGVLKVGCVNGGIFSAEENKRLPETLDPIPELFLNSGDVLISRANTRELFGSSALVDSDQSNLMLSDKLFRLRTTKIMLPKHLVFYLGTSIVRHQIELEATGASSSMLNIGQAVIKELAIPVPPSTEQCDIATKLEGSLRKLNQLHKEAQLTQELLQERRSALISAAVTGKIDVQSWQAPASSPTAQTLETAHG